MVSRSDATRALDGVNGRTLARGAAEAAVLKAAKGQKGRQLARANKERVQKAAQPGRVVAVDWALSKKKWEEKAAQSETETDAEDDEDDDEDDDEEDDEEDEGSDLEPIAVGDADEQDDEESEEEKGPQKPALPAPEEGTTLFVRNLAYEATEEELRNV